VRETIALNLPLEGVRVFDAEEKVLPRRRSTSAMIAGFFA
jgi:hypothetical protein